jgi:hypothetical protein
MDSSLPYIITGLGLFLLFLGWRGAKTGKVRGTYETQGTRDPRYYVRIVGYFLGGLALLVIGGTQLAERFNGYALTGIFLGILLIAWLIYRIPRWLASVQERAKRSVKEKIQSKKKKRETATDHMAPEIKRWPLAAVAFYAHMRGWKDDQLNQTATAKRAAKRYLKQDWEINNEDDFEDIQEWLFDSGHRKDFYAFVNAIEQMSEEGLVQYVQEVGLGQRTFDDGAEPEEVLHRIKLIRQDAAILRMNGFMAWDLLRYIDNCRLGYLAGYLDQETAEANMHSAAQILQSRFSSWRELADNFLLGREFWSIRAMREDGALFRNAISRLFDDPESPWHDLPFNLALSK